jgi:hypothetical protein
MADFSTVCDPNNRTLTLHCGRVVQYYNSFAAYGTCLNTQTLQAGQSAPVSFINSQQSVLNGITVSNSNLFTISTEGVYLAQCFITSDLAQEAGSQSGLSASLSGTAVVCDVAYGSASPNNNVKLTSNVIINVLPNTPVTLQFTISNTSTSAASNFRYAQLSICRLV